MHVLSDLEIRHARDSGALAIEPFTEANLTPNGYDLTASEVVRPDEEGGMVPQREGKVAIPPLGRFAVATREVITLDASHCASLWLRSSYARRGAMAAFGKVDAGFSGTLTIGMFNAGAKPFELPIGDRFCQIVFEKLGSPAEKVYAQRSGNFQHQRGVTLERR
ncbi:MAG: dCTP deaminase [Thermoplasmatota archaeon]